MERLLNPPLRFERSRIFNSRTFRQWPLVAALPISLADNNFARFCTRRLSASVATSAALRSRRHWLFH